MGLFRESIRTLANKIITSFYRRLIVVARPLAPAPLFKPGPGVTIRPLTPTDVDVYCALRKEYSAKGHSATGHSAKGHSAEDFLARLAGGEHCFGVFLEDRLVHLCWATGQRTYLSYLWSDLIPQPGDIYLFGSYTPPEYRQHGFASLSGAYLFNHFLAEGFSRTIGLVAPENTPGLRNVGALGYVGIGQLNCLRLGRWQFNWQKAWSAEPLPRVVKVGQAVR